MRRNPLRALALGALLAGGAAALAWAVQPGAASPGATHLGSYTWRPGWDGAGGYSALWLGAGGRPFLILSDKGFWVAGRLDRAEDGAVSGVAVEGRGALRDTAEGERSPFERFDSEAIAVGPSGAIYVAFEQHHRIMRFESIDAVPRRVAQLRDLPRMVSKNRGIEALAISKDSTLYALPEERVGGVHPVVAGGGDGWRTAMGLPARGFFWKVAGADIGPDGRLYVLERAFLGIGFRSRVRSFALDGSDEREVLVTALRRHDNLEGIHVWRDAVGLRMTLVSDDNLRPRFQRTEFVDYRLPP
jgi:hypothetical protein